MNALRKTLVSAGRWSWFVFLVLLAFAYLVAGLSDSTETPITALKNETAGTLDSDRDSIQATVEKLNQLRHDALAEEGFPSAERADWLTLCRRMSLALVGSGLSLEEIRELQAIPEPQRASVHLEVLLQDSRFHHYWGERWTRFLVGTDEGQFIVYRRRRFRIWLSETFAENWRYDRLVRTLITAKGLWTDQPEVNFLTSTFDSNANQPDPIRLAARTSRAFLGLRIDCLQCHDDFLGNVSLGDLQATRGGLQTDFHQLAAFFTAAKSTGLQGVRDGKADYHYQYLDADEEVKVEPKVPYQREELPSEGNDRMRLAKWITSPKNHQASVAAVSHVWALMLGRPLEESVDNLPLDQDHSRLLDALADDFSSHGYNLRRLIRLIAKCDSFCVDSRADFEISAEHEEQGAVFPLVRLRPEQVAGCVIQASRIKRTDRDSSFLLQLMALMGNNDFVQRYGDIGEDEFESDSITITQRLVMMNGDMVVEHVKNNPVLNTTSHINMFTEDDSVAIDTLYLCVLGRYPTNGEQDHFLERFRLADHREKEIQNLMWILINSSEMAWNH